MHGEDSVCDEFTECLKEEYGYDATWHHIQAEETLLQTELSPEGVKERKRPEERRVQQRETVSRLVAAGKRLDDVVITNNEGGTNKDPQVYRSD